MEISWEQLLRRRTVHSPLRYPGGKRRLVPYVATIRKGRGCRQQLARQQAPVAVGPKASGQDSLKQRSMSSLIGKIRKLLGLGPKA